jgi:hypothetical protein
MTNIEKGAIAGVVLLGGYYLLSRSNKVTPVTTAVRMPPTLGLTEHQPAAVKGKVSTMGKAKGAGAKIFGFLKHGAAKAASVGASQLKTAATQQADQFGAKYGLTGLGTNALA